MSLGLALAGGGLKGLAYIGVIKALEELEIKIDYLSGTSSGSMFASFYAMGYTSNEIKEKAIDYYKNNTTNNYWRAISPSEWTIRLPNK